MQKDLAADIELNLKKKARRRLVGAIALVLLLVILLPFLLTDRTQSVPNANVQITLEDNNHYVDPSSEEVVTDFDSAVKPRDDETQNATSQNIEIAKKPVEPVRVEEKVSVEKSDETGKEQKVDLPKTAVKSEPSKIEVTKSKETKPNAVDKMSVEAKPKTIKVENKTTEKVSQDSNSSYFVQIGAFSDADKVQTLAQKMQSLGYQSKTEKVKSDKGVLIRLRSQSFSSRNEAAIALENMKDAGLTGMVVSQ
jgi:DedD protein